jgi:hypothetical protein
MSRWEPQRCHHGKQGLAGGCEACFEEHSHLSHIATQRAAMETVATDLKTRAGKIWADASENGSEYQVAEAVRELGREYEKRAKKFSDEQDALLKQAEKDREKAKELRQEAEANQRAKR